MHIHRFTTYDFGHSSSALPELRCERHGGRMDRLSRRSVLKAATATAAGLGVASAYALLIKGERSRPAAGAPPDLPAQRPAADLPARPTAILKENGRTGSAGWEITGRRAADDVYAAVKGYASHTSVSAGERLSFHVTTHEAEEFGIAVYRVGAYRGAGARLVYSSPVLRGVRQPAPRIDEATGLITCGWDAAWSVTVPESWLSGYYLAVFTTTSGWRNYTAFVVRDGRPADYCVIVPFTTYQAYNMWPFDGTAGRSLYYGFDPAAPKTAAGKAAKSYTQRALTVGFDRPFQDIGLPKLSDLDRSFAQWAEGRGLDVTYAVSDDLHAGRVDPRRYRGLVFSGHDEYWTPQMRATAERAVAEGTNLVFLSANNAYWRMRFEPGADGTANRVIACYKTDPDPVNGPEAATLRWRDAGPNPARPEQTLIGVMYNGIVAQPAPLVVRESGHWLWKGTGVRDGDRIPDVVAGEADGFTPGGSTAAGDLTLLASSPYGRPSQGTGTQNTTLLQAPSGALVFAAGSMLFPRKLFGPSRADRRIQGMTANVLGRIISH